MRRPVIGVATQTLPGIAGQRPNCWIMGHHYVEALRKVGAVPWLIPLLPHDPETMQAIFDELDGVFLTGVRTCWCPECDPHPCQGRRQWHREIHDL